MGGGGGHVMVGGGGGGGGMSGAGGGGGFGVLRRIPSAINFEGGDFVMSERQVFGP